MDKESVDPRIFTWTVKVGTAIITFMAGILVYMHRKLHDMDKAFAINQERDTSREAMILEVKDTVKNIDSKLNEALAEFSNQKTLYKDLTETIEDMQKLRKMN